MGMVSRTQPACQPSASSGHAVIRQRHRRPGPCRRRSHLFARRGRGPQARRSSVGCCALLLLHLGRLTKRRPELSALRGWWAACAAHSAADRGHGLIGVVLVTGWVVAAGRVGRCTRDGRGWGGRGALFEHGRAGDGWVWVGAPGIGRGCPGWARPHGACWPCCLQRTGKAGPGPHSPAPPPLTALFASGCPTGVLTGPHTSTTHPPFKTGTMREILAIQVRRGRIASPGPPCPVVAPARYPWSPQARGPPAH